MLARSFVSATASNVKFRKLHGEVCEVCEVSLAPRRDKKLCEVALARWCVVRCWFSVTAFCVKFCTLSEVVMFKTVIARRLVLRQHGSMVVFNFQ